MFSSIRYSSLPPNLDPRRALSLAKQHGFAGVQIQLGNTAAPYGATLGFDASDDEIQAVRTLAAKIGITIDSVALGPNFELNPLSYAPRLLEAAVLLGAPACILEPDPVDTDCRYDQAVERLLDTLEALLPRAEEADVKLLVPAPAPGAMLFASPLEICDLIDHHESAHLGICLDVAACNPLPEHWARILGWRIGYVYATEESYHGVQVLPLQGWTDWPALLRALREAGYRGALAGEHHVYEHAPELTVQHLAASLQTLLTR